MNWTEFLTLAASAGLLSAAFSAGMAAIGAHFTRRRHARFLALRVALQLDAYFHECGRRIGEIKAHDASGGHHGTLFLDIPLPPEPPEDETGWINLNPALSDKALSFSSRVSYMNGAIQSDLEHHVGPDDDVDTSRILTYLYQISQDAYLLALHLRSDYNFSQLDHSEASYKWLIEAKEKHALFVAEQKEKMREQSERMWEDMSRYSANVFRDPSNAASDEQSQSSDSRG